MFTALIRYQLVALILLVSSILGAGTAIVSAYFDYDDSSGSWNGCNYTAAVWLDTSVPDSEASNSNALCDLAAASGHFWMDTQQQWFQINSNYYNTVYIECDFDDLTWYAYGYATVQQPTGNYSPTLSAYAHY